MGGGGDIFRILIINRESLYQIKNIFNYNCLYLFPKGKRNKEIINLSSFCSICEHLIVYDFSRTNELIMSMIRSLKYCFFFLCYEGIGKQQDG